MWENPWTKASVSRHWQELYDSRYEALAIFSSSWRNLVLLSINDVTHCGATPHMSNELTCVRWMRACNAVKLSRQEFECNFASAIPNLVPLENPDSRCTHVGNRSGAVGRR